VIHTFDDTIYITIAFVKFYICYFRDESLQT